MLSNIISLSKNLISIKSTPGNKDELEKALSIAISNLDEFTIEQFEKDGIKSALIYNSKKRPKKFKIILNGHLDVIPGKKHQYSAEIKNDKLYGVGSMDMKSSIACMIMVFKQVAKKVNYPLGLQIVTDEEVGGFNGTKHQIDKGVRADFVIAGESTGLNIANKAKGALWLKIKATGKSAHGAYSWKGKNAILEMNKFIDILMKKYPTPRQKEWITTINLSRIETNNITFNKIPDDCVVWLDIRYVPEETDVIMEKIKKMLPKEFGLDVVVNEPALFVDENNQYVKKLKQIDEKNIKKKVSLYGAQGSSDARHFTKVGCNGIEFGPIGGNIGSDNEWVDINSLRAYYNILKDFLLSIDQATSDVV